MIKKYKKTPVVIEAIKWNGNNDRDVFDFLETARKDQYMTNTGDSFYIDHSKVKGGLIIRTLVGEHIASIGDWIIKNISGEFYPCKPDIFEATYEEVAETETQGATPSFNKEFKAHRSSPKDYSVCPQCGKRYYNGMTVSKIEGEDGCTKCMVKLHNPS